jgi:hypothetical protein
MRASRPWTLLALVLVGWGRPRAVPRAAGGPAEEHPGLQEGGRPAPNGAGDGRRLEDRRAARVQGYRGKNLHGGSTEVTMRSVHTEDTVYFLVEYLVEYKDPTLSARREPW